MSTPPPAPPITFNSAVLGVTAVAGDGSVTLSWGPVSSAVSYNIYRSLASGVTGTQVASPDSSSAAYIDRAVENGTTYYYRVSSVTSTGENGISGQVSAMPAVQSGSITISGAVHYEDKEYGLSGFTVSKPLKAIRCAAVEIVSSETSSVLYSGLTDSNGFYSIITAPAQTVYVRVKAEATLSGEPRVTVKNPSGQIYATGSGDFVLSGSANLSITVPATSIGGVFNILDVLISGIQFMHSLSGTYPPVRLSAYWKRDNPYGTYYCMGGCPSGDGIYVYNRTSQDDTDEYDDDVLYHEFGHFAADHFSRDDSPGGVHRLSDDDLDMRLAWSEGWGDFFPGAVKSWLNTAAPHLLSSAAGVSPTQYIDTYGNTAGISIDMGDPDGTYGSSYRYAANEVAIAKILSDVNKNFGMQDLWDVISDFKANPAATPLKVNLDLFWDRWHSLGKPALSGSTSVSIESIFSGRSVLYTDLYSNTTFSSAKYVPASFGTPDTLYAGADYFVFDATAGVTYTITTVNLRSGADTVLEVYRFSNLTVPGYSNDNGNGFIYSGDLVPSDKLPSLCDAGSGPCHENRPDILTSKVSFTAEASGPCYIKVYSAPARPVSAGRYGSYTLKISP